MRPLSRATAKSSSPERPISAQVARRRELRRQRRRALLVQLWRLVAMVLLSGGFAWILLRHGWTLRGPEAVILQGGASLQTNQVVEAAKLRFPQPLLEVSPRALEQQLLSALPVRSAQVERKMLPARLIIRLKPQIPIAQAERQGPAGRERGLLNAEGHWIPLTAASPEPLTEILVRGWNDQQRGLVAALLQQRDRFKGMLKAVVLQPDGNVSLVTTGLGRIDLGGDPALLNTQIETIVHLNNTLPEHLRQVGQSSLDLSNPDRPELQLPNPPAPKKPETQP